MKKVPFYLIIFLLTTGFFRSTLEKCADYHFSLSNVLPTAEYATQNVPEAIYKKRYDEYLKKQKILNIKKQKYKAEWNKLDKCKKYQYFKYGEKVTCKSISFMSDFLHSQKMFVFQLPREPSKTETVIKRKFTENEIKRNLKKFLNQSLKTKLRLADQSKLGGQHYLDWYNACIAYKEENAQLFNDKYN